MAYVVPNSEIQFFRNPNIDPDYENTIYFPDPASKDAYFDNLPHLTVSNCYYQREEREWCRVELPMSQLYNRTYMRFRNTSFENKWFYAFITEVVYVNNITTQVYYTIDKMMTWMGDFDVDECFVERNHSLTDNIGDNVVVERFDVGEKVYNDVSTTGYMDEYCFLLAQTPTRVYPTPSSSRYGYYSGLVYHYFSDVGALNSWLSVADQSDIDAIQGLYYVPVRFFPNIVRPSDGVTNPAYGPIELGCNIAKPVAGHTTIDGHTPRNNKLYTYPFYNLLVKSTEGESKEFRFERFKTAYAQFKIRGIVGEQSQISLIPLSYNHPNATDYCYNDAMILTGFPMCSWNIDTYKAFLAQQLVTLPATLLKGAGQAIVGDVAGAVATGANTTLQYVTGMFQSNLHPYENRGKDSPQLSLSTNGTDILPYKDFYFYRESIKRELAERLDGYFDMFGYAQNRLMQPQMCARPYYTYVKTIGCHISGFMPASDMREIEEIFNRGVRLWKGSALASDPTNIYIGNYSLNNAPVPST